MFEELHDIQRRYEELAYRISTPEAAADAAAYAALMRDYKELTPLVETWQSYRALQAEIAEEQQALQDEQDPAFTDMVQQELRKNRETLSALEENLKLLLLPKDADDDKSIIMEIRAGTGGEEAALFARDLWRMYTMYAAQRGWTCETVEANETELGGFKEIIFSIEGAGVYSRLKLRAAPTACSACRKPKPRAASRHRRPPWPSCPKRRRSSSRSTPKTCASTPSAPPARAASTSTRPPAPSASPTCPPAWWWECQDQRSQRENKDRALKVLRSRLLQQKQAAYDEAYNARRQSQVGSGDRSERIRTYNFPQGRVTDHRIGLTLYKLDAVLDGALDLLVEPLLLADREEKLKRQSEA